MNKDIIMEHLAGTSSTDDGAYAPEQRARVLVETLPYIQRFAGKVVVLFRPHHALI